MRATRFLNWLEHLARGASLLNVVSYSVIGWPASQKLLPCSNTQERTMRKFHSITALCGDGLRPELQALFDRLAIDPRSELFVRDDGGSKPVQTPLRRQ